MSIAIFVHMTHRMAEVIIQRLFRRIKGFRRGCTRYEKPDVMYLAFFNLALICNELKRC
jgi:hypothetical protein